MQPWHKDLDFERGQHIASLPDGEASILSELDNLRRKVEQVRSLLASAPRKLWPSVPQTLFGVWLIGVWLIGVWLIYSPDTSHSSSSARKSCWIVGSRPPNNGKRT
jgi:hypothetical protein